MTARNVLHQGGFIWPFDSTTRQAQARNKSGAGFGRQPNFKLERRGFVVRDGIIATSGRGISRLKTTISHITAHPSSHLEIWPADLTASSIILGAAVTVRHCLCWCLKTHLAANLRRGRRFQCVLADHISEAKFTDFVGFGAADDDNYSFPPVVIHLSHGPKSSGCSECSVFAKNKGKTVFGANIQKCFQANGPSGAEPDHSRLINSLREVIRAHKQTPPPHPTPSPALSPIRE